MSVPEYTTDWSGSIAHWPKLLHHFVGRRDLRFLEIGCFEGRTTRWLLEHVLTHITSRVEVVDPFSFAGQRERFDENLAPWLGTNQLLVWKLDSHAAFANGWLTAPRDDDKFHFVYVDGDHHAAQVLDDAVRVWPLVRPGGMVVFDDYHWPEIADDLAKPTIAVDAFAACYAAEIAVARRCGRDQYLIVKKRS